MNNHTISSKISLNDVLERLNFLGNNLTLFIIDENFKVIGSITDGDIRRGLVRGLDLNSNVQKAMELNFKYIKYNCIDIYQDHMIFKFKRILLTHHIFI
jgi:predicted transcriptional regulator